MGVFRQWQWMLHMIPSIRELSSLKEKNIFFESALNKINTCVKELKEQLNAVAAQLSRPRTTNNLSSLYYILLCEIRKSCNMTARRPQGSELPTVVNGDLVRSYLEVSTPCTFKNVEQILRRLHEDLSQEGKHNPVMYPDFASTQRATFPSEGFYVLFPMIGSFFEIFHQREQNF